MYKIEEESFYVELCKDVAGEQLGFNNPPDSGTFGVNEARQWIVDYELAKLRETLVRKNMTRDKFKKDFIQNEEHFCKYVVGFLPKKRRKVLWRKLQKDIKRGKLNNERFNDPK